VCRKPAHWRMRAYVVVTSVRRHMFLDGEVHYILMLGLLALAP